MTNEPSNDPMGELPPQDETEKLLANLRSEHPFVRRDAAQAIARANLTDVRLIEALNQAAANDANDASRNAARKALVALNQVPPPLGPELAKKRRDFWMGFGLFFGLNIALWVCQIAFYWLITTLNSDMLYSDAMGVVSLVLGILPWLLNIGLIIFLAFKRPQMALGMLAGFGVALLIVVCLFLIVAAVCFVTLSSGGF